MSTVRDHGRSHREYISAQLSDVLDPLAARCRGWPVEDIRPVIAQAWRREFGGKLSDAALSDSAVALRDGRPWCEALWTAGW